MNILLVTNGFPPTAFGGVEIYTYDLSKGLVREGHRVTVFCRESDFSLPDYHTIDAEEDGKRVIRVVNDYKKIYSFRDTFVDDQIEAIFKKYLLEISPDIVHFNHYIALSAQLPIIAAGYHVPSLVTLHDFWPLCHRVNLIDWKENICNGPQANGENCASCVVGGAQRQKVANSLNWLTKVVKSTTTPRLRDHIRRSIPGGYKQPAPLYSSADIFQERYKLFIRAIQKSNHILAPSNFVRSQYLTNGIKQEIEVLPLGIDINANEIQPTELKRKTDSPLVFSTIGSIIPIKGIDTLIHAFRNISSDNIRLEIHGREDIIPAYAEEVKQLAQGDERIVFMGPFEPSQRRDVYNSIDVLVVPSKALESFSLVCREALLLGKPVIAARIGALPEIVIDRENGFLFDPENVEELSEILDQIAHNPASLRSLNLPGPVHIPSLNDHLKSIEGLYLKIKNKKRL